MSSQVQIQEAGGGGGQSLRRYQNGCEFRVTQSPAKESRWPLEAGKGKWLILPPAPQLPERAGSADTLILAPRGISDLQNARIINFCVSSRYM